MIKRKDYKFNREKEDEKKTITDKIDSILIHQTLGIPIFLFLMWAVPLFTLGIL